MLPKIIKKINLMWVWGGSVPIFLISLYLFRLYPLAEFLILSIAAVVYLILTLLHHLKDQTLTLEIMIEYILIAALALIFLQSILF